MLEEFRQYTNLGTLGYYWEVIRLLHAQPDTSWGKIQIDAHFHNRIVDGEAIFDGGLTFLVSAGVIEVDINGHYHPTYQFKHPLHTADHCRGKVLDAIIEAVTGDDEVYEIFTTEHCSFDFINNSIQVNKSAFGLRHANLRDALVNLEFLLPHPNYPRKSFLVNKSHKKLFDKYLIKGIRARQMTPDQLRNMQAIQHENGLEGEKFALEYERTRTGRQDIEWIANYDVSAGFDIMSFETSTSSAHDRFIEVKAYSGDIPYFYWSRNEVEVANEKRNQYFLYLVNLHEISRPDYTPIILRDPNPSLLISPDWTQTIEKYRFDYKQSTSQTRINERVAQVSH